MSVGDFAVSTIFDKKFTTVNSLGAPTTLAGSPAVSVYKDNSTTQSTAGVTLTVDFDGVTGLHNVRIDTSADGTFYAAGSCFQIVLTAGTVGGTSVVGYVVDDFSIEKGAALRPTVAGRTLGIEADGMAHADVKEWLGVAPLALTSQRVESLTGAMAANVITASAINADAITDAKVASDVTIASVTGAVGSVTGAVGSVTGNVGGNVTGSVGSVATGGITAASIADNAIDAGAIAADAITAGKIADNAITAAKIADGAIDAATFAANAITATAIAADAITDAKVASDVTIASVTGAVGSVTGNVGGNVTGSVGSVTGLTASNLDATVSSRSSHSAADVWAAGTRTLTSFGSLVADIWAGVTQAFFAKFFTEDSGEVAGDAVAGSVVKEIVDNAGGGSAPTANEIADEVETRTIAGVTTVGSVTGNVGGNVAGSVASVTAKVTPIDVDGLTHAKAMEVIMAALFNVAAPSGSTVVFNKRDGTTATLTLTYGAADGERTASVIS